jgi:4-hydroxythreonine-4-phosphate dehydrogenase
MTARTRPIAVTPGDPFGIGPEVALKASREAQRDGIPIVLVGDGATWLDWAMRLGLADDAIPLDDASRLIEMPVDDAGGTPGPTAGGGRVALEAIERATAGCISGEFSAMVTAPVSKESLAMAGSSHVGHTELIAERAGVHNPVMVMTREAPPSLRVALVTIHVPLRDVAGLVTPDRVAGTLSTLAGDLRLRWGIDHPRLALLGLNPHAGDGGVIGDEESVVLAPAMEVARAAGVDVSGPFSADAFFGRGSWQRFDAVVACYHDQGLVPFKTIAQGGGVNVTCGLPFVRTSPDHGTAFDIAGTGRADDGSMVEAIRLAARLSAST